MPKWEYRILEARFPLADEFLEELNQLGEEGWEVVTSHCVVAEPLEGHYYCLKREIQ